MTAPPGTDVPSRRVLVLGSTGTIGRATVRALLACGHEVVCLVRRGADAAGTDLTAQRLAGAAIRVGDVTDPASIAGDGIRGERFDVLVSCLASRTGGARDAWAIDHDAHVGALRAAQDAGIAQMILLSAICVQKPLLAFQQAKLAFERALIASGIDYSIVRPTAFFKSLSGQVDRVSRGKPFLLFGDGRLTACTPISDDDLAQFIAGCIDNEARRNRILPIGGPGEPITPAAQAEMLFALLGRTPRVRHVPVALLDLIIATLTTLGRVSPTLAAKADLARIGRYYATESMLVLNEETGAYDAAATPATGTDTLAQHYARLLAGDVVAESGDHAVFRQAPRQSLPTTH